MAHDQNGFRLVLCPVKDPDKQHLDTYQKIYQCWHEVWEAAFKEINYTDCLYSDDFTRQDFAAAVFHQDECAGLILFRYVDLTSAAIQKDSYFKQWNEVHIKKLMKLGKKLMICGQLSVPPRFRQNAFGVSMKDLMVSMVNEVTLHTDVDVTVTTPRRNKSIHNMTNKWGAHVIAENIEWGHGVQVDLAAFCREDIAHVENPDLQPLITQLWEEKLVIKQMTHPVPMESFEYATRYGRNVIPLKKVAG